MPQEVKDMVSKQMNEQENLFTLADLPPGSLFEYGETVALKSEYRTESGAIEATILGTGEMFWGGTDNAADQVKLIVKRVTYVPYSNLQKLKNDLELTGKQLYTAIEFICSMEKKK
jgi:hypothetical protein